MNAACRTASSLGLSVLVAGFLLPACSKDSTSDQQSGGSSATAGTAAGNDGGRPGGAGTGGATAATGGSAVGGAGGTRAGAGRGAGGLAPGGSAGALGASGGAAGRAPSGGQGGSTADAGTSAGGQAGTDNAGQGSGAGGSGGGVGNGTLKIISIGDSITRVTCWRAKLWQSLKTAHAGHFDLVGTLQQDNGCNISGSDPDNQGYSSSLLTEVVAGVTDARSCDPFCPTLDDFAAAFDTTKPDVALIHYGTNDVWNGKAASDITAGYGQLVDKLRETNANVKVFVAKIIPMSVSESTCGGCSCSACATAVPALNSAIDQWVPTKSTAASPVIAVDQYTGFDATADTKDGVHPNDSGSAKMAAKWGAALEPLF